MWCASVQTVQYIQPQHHERLGQAELLVIDEAAAIPLPLVKAMLGPYLVFLCSTVNGCACMLSHSSTHLCFCSAKLVLPFACGVCASCFTPTHKTAKKLQPKEIGGLHKDENDGTHKGGVHENAMGWHFLPLCLSVLLGRRSFVCCMHNFHTARQPVK